MTVSGRVIMNLSYHAVRLRWIQHPTQCMEQTLKTKADCHFHVSVFHKRSSGFKFWTSGSEFNKSVLTSVQNVVNMNEADVIQICCHKTNEE